MPPFPSSTSPELWDELSLLAGTVFLEAEGEEFLGQLAVAWVIRNRADHAGTSILIEALRPHQFSAWNADARVRAEARLCSAEGPAVEGCWQAAAAAYWRMLPDPTGNARFYLNVELTRKIRKDGSLPPWAEEKLAAQMPLVIGAHTFLV